MTPGPAWVWRAGCASDRPFVPKAYYYLFEADCVKTLTDIRDSIVERVSDCDNAVLLSEIERLLESEKKDEPLLTLDDDDIRALLRDLLDE